jgi:E3 ubiquitin-protein ligase listerin
MKKDPTTKIKALKELIELTNQSDIEMVRAALPYFPKIYNQLSTDIDGRVRETCQFALTAMINKVGKNLAIILKQIFGSWICSMYDTHPTAASIASNIFNKTFTSQKVSDVFIHCEVELLDFFYKNLNVHSTQTICNPKTYTEEEREAKYSRLLISSFRGYALYLEKIPQQRLKENSEEKNRLIIENDKFWSHHKSKNSQVRSSFFEAVANLLHQGAFLLTNVGQKLTTIVFKSIGEEEPEVLNHIWTCIVLTQQEIDNWVDYVNFEKSFLPKLSKILRTANFPTLIFPNLLPLISKIDKAITTKDELDKFYLRFFEDIKYGMMNAQLGKSELSAVTSAYFEILQYVIIQLDAKENEEFIFNLLDDHVIAVIYWCINAETNFGRAVFSQIRNFIQYFSKNDVHCKMIERFWSELYLVLNSSIMTPSTNTKNIAMNHVELIKQLRTVKKTSGKIRFQDQVDSSSQNDSSNDDGNSENVFADHLINFASKLCVTYIDRINTTHETAFVENLEIFIKEYQSKLFLKSLTSWNDAKETRLSSLVETFSNWLKIEALSSELIVEIILVLYKYTDETDKIDLSKIMEISTARMWLIERTLSHPFCNNLEIVKFIKSNEVTDYLVECAEFVIKNASNADKLSILQKSFFRNDEGTMLIDSKTCTKIVEIISKPLTDDKLANQMDQCASFLAQIFPVISTDAEFDAVKLMIFHHLFEISVMKDVSKDFSDDTLWEVASSWEDALSAEEVSIDENLLSKCAEIIQKKLNSILLINFSIQSMQKFAKLITKLINCVTEQESSENKLQAIEKVLTKTLKFNEESSNYIENISTFTQLLKGNLCSRNIHDVPENNFFIMMNTYLRYNLLCLETIVELCCNSNDDDEDEDDEDCNNEQKWTEWNEFLTEFFLKVCYADANFNIILNELNRLTLDEWILYLQERLKFALGSLSDNIFQIIRESLFKKASKDGGLWIESVKRLLDTKAYDNIGMLYKDVENVIQRQNSQISDANFLQSFASLTEKKTMSISAINSSDLLIKISFTRSLLKNYLDVDNFNQYGDRKIVGHSLILLTEIIQKQNIEKFLLYNSNVATESDEVVMLASEVARFFSDLLTFIPYELDEKAWDFVRLGMSSWVLSVSKSVEKISENKVRIFVASIFNLNAALYRFFKEEKTKSSTPLLKDVIDEWEKVFAKDVYVILTKTFVNIIKQIGKFHKINSQFFIFRSRKSFKHFFVQKNL